VTGDSEPAARGTPTAEVVSAAEPLQLKEFIRVVLVHKTTVLGCFVLALLGALIMAFSQAPIFRGTALLLIEPKKISVMTNVQEVYDPTTTGDDLANYYRTQYELLRSRRIVEPVAEELNARAHVEFKDARDLVAALGQGIVVEPVRDSRLVRVSVESRDPGFAAQAANALVERFVRESNERAMGLSDTGLKTLREQEKALRPKYERAAKALQQFKEDNNIVTFDQSQSMAAVELKLLADELTHARAARMRAAVELRAATAAVESGQPAGTLPDTSYSRQLEILRGDLLKLEQERDNLLRHYRPEHPQTRAIEAQVARARTQIQDQERLVVKELESAYLAALENEQKLTDTVTESEGRMSELGRKAILLDLLKQEADQIAASYKSVTSRIEEVELAMATGSRESNIFIIDRALVPDSPIRPRKGIYILTGAAMGLIAGFTLAFALEHLDNTIKGKTDIEELTGYPVLGFVGRVNESTGPVELSALSSPRSGLAETFRTIRTGLAFTLPANFRSPLVVTSTASGDGKTFVSVNLAFALAQTGKRVLLIEGDLRRPRIHKVFGIEDSEVGVSTTIAAPVPTLDAVVTTKVAPTLDVMVAGPKPPNPAELLAGQATKDLLELACRTYDWVVVDAPPLLAVTDASILVAHSRYCVFVARSFATPREGLRRAHELLVQAKAHVAGAILNNVDVPIGHEPRYYHGYYYRELGYGAERYGYRDREPT
jgi:capsular exopolysaccharide synthesis family protein